MYKMRQSDNVADIKHLFGIYAKNNSDGEFVIPHIFNFISFGNYFLYIQKDRRNVYKVYGRLPFHVRWITYDSRKDSLCYFKSRCYSRTRTQFYVLAQRLMTSQYVEKKDKCPVLSHTV